MNSATQFVVAERGRGRLDAGTGRRGAGHRPQQSGRLQQQQRRRRRDALGRRRRRRRRRQQQQRQQRRSGGSRSVQLLFIFLVPIQVSYSAIKVFHEQFGFT